LDEVAQLRTGGHEVEVLSLDPLAAAHRYMTAPGLPAALEVALAGARFDSVVVQLEPGLPVRIGARRPERAVALLALAVALRRLDEVTIRWDRPDDLPGGPGGRPGRALWATARRIDLGPAVDADELAALLPDGRERLRVVRPGAATPIVEPDVNWGDGTGITAAQVNEVVRRRAAATRQSLVQVMGRSEGSVQPVVRVDQWEWLPAPGLGVPDLGQLVSNGSRRPADGRSMRQVAALALASAERHSATRPAARMARWALSEVRAATRSR